MKFLVARWLVLLLVDQDIKVLLAARVVVFQDMSGSLLVDL